MLIDRDRSQSTVWEICHALLRDGARSLIAQAVEADLQARRLEKVHDAINRATRRSALWRIAAKSTVANSPSCTTRWPSTNKSRT